MQKSHDTIALDISARASLIKLDVINDAQLQFEFSVSVSAEESRSFAN